MNKTTNALLDSSEMFGTWMKSVNDFWAQMTPPDSSSKPPENTAESNNTEENPTAWLDQWQSVLENWQTMASAMSGTSLSTQPFQNPQMFSDTLLQMSQPVFTNVTQMLHQWQSQLLQSADQVSPFDFNTIETDVFKAWENIYDKDLRKFLKAPQLGLTREHQEKVARFMDRYHLLHAALAEFIGILAVPFKKTYTDFQEKLAELSQNSAMPADVNDYYRMWLKILEGHYMVLFQSPDYIQSLTKTLAASAAYTRAKKELVNDLLQQFSIPSSDHLDAVYSELHNIKKRLKVLEKAVTNR